MGQIEAQPHAWSGTKYKAWFQSLRLSRWRERPARGLSRPSGNCSCIALPPASMPSPWPSQHLGSCPAAAPDFDVAARRNGAVAGGLKRLSRQRHSRLSCLPGRAPLTIMTGWKVP